MPTQVIAVWMPAGCIVNGAPQRGFAGRVTFYNSKTKKGVKVDGDILICGFDDTNDKYGTEAKPDKVFVFSPEDLKKLHSYSKESGHSYSIWVAWDDLGANGDMKKISLLVKYVSKDNASAVLSGIAQCQLPGKETPETFADTERTYNEGNISQVGHNKRDMRKESMEDELYSTEMIKRKMTTSTINIPSSPAGYSNPIVNPAANPAVNPIVNPVVNPIVHPAVNPIVNPVVYPASNPNVNHNYNYNTGPQPTDVMPPNHFTSDPYFQSNSVRY